MRIFVLGVLDALGRPLEEAEIPDRFPNLAVEEVRSILLWLALDGLICRRPNGQWHVALAFSGPCTRNA